MKMLITLALVLSLLSNCTTCSKRAFAHEVEEEWWECDECFVTWQLTMTTERNLFDMDEKYVSWDKCVRDGMRRMEYHITQNKGDESGKRPNPFRWTGFMCGTPKEEPIEEPISKVVPKCLDPMRECA